MATIALSRPIHAHSPAAEIPSPVTPPRSLNGACPSPSSQHRTDSVHGKLPHVYIPRPTKLVTSDDIDTPPASPQVAAHLQQRSLLHPPHAYTRIDAAELSIYEIAADQLAQALDFAARQPLPSSSLVFPWLHGFRPSRQLHQTLIDRPPGPVKSPPCLRGLTLVKADGDLSVGRLKGAISPDDFLCAGSIASFADPDSTDGSSIRNFHIQPAKVAITSDIVVYGNNTSETRKLSWHIAAARLRWRDAHLARGFSPPEYNTFVCTGTFSDFEQNYQHLVVSDSLGRQTGQVLDLAQQERVEMRQMTEVSEISHNVFMGPTPEHNSPGETKFDILIECCDLGRLNPAALRYVAKSREQATRSFLDFPSSGSILPPTWSNEDADGILETCRWIYYLAHGWLPDIDDVPIRRGQTDTQRSSMRLKSNERTRARKILLHCADGYTESTLLGIAYFSFSTGRPVPEAWLHMHTVKRRNLFAYPTDVALLTALAPRLIRESPACIDYSENEIENMVGCRPRWLADLDGSFPSRMMDYLYLGNLTHANNPELLRKLGIKQLLSVGETVDWDNGDMELWGTDNVCVVRGVQDNGIDSLMNEFARCFEFIGKFVARWTVSYEIELLTREGTDMMQIEDEKEASPPWFIAGWVYPAVLRFVLLK